MLLAKGDLHGAVAHFEQGRRPTIALAACTVQIACRPGGGVPAALTAAARLRDCIVSGFTPIVALQQLQALILRFPRSRDLANSARDIFLNARIRDLVAVRATALLLMFGRNYRAEIMRGVVLHLLAQAPEAITLDLLAVEAEEEEEEDPTLDELLDIARAMNSTVFSQMETVHEKLIGMVSTVFHHTMASVGHFSKLITTRREKATAVLVGLLGRLPEIAPRNQSIHDADFLKEKGPWIRERLRALLNNPDPQEASTDAALLVSQLRTTQDSIRVIQLDHLAAQLAKKTNWQIPVFGHADRQDLRIARFFHTVDLLDDGVRVATIGTNGKKYNFHVLRTDPTLISQSEQFAATLNTLIAPGGVNQRDVTPLDRHAVLYEILKGHVSMKDLVLLYDSSRDGETRVEDLRAALLSTSRNVRSWIARSSAFARSMGSLSALAWVIGGVDTSPSGLLIDRTHGTVTSAKFFVLPQEQIVPFRLTPMVVAAFGSPGVDGTFRVALRNAIRPIRKWAMSLAPFLQFAVGDIGAWAGMPSIVDPENDMDLLYGRIAGKMEDLDKDVAALIQKASDHKNYTRMPPQWSADW
jgi:hypothetical protein